MHSYRKHYQRAYDAEPGRLHFAAHSHHPWPDVTRDAHLRYWDDSVQRLDEKWDYLFTEVFPKTQRHISTLLGTSDSSRICLGPSVHAFLARILSCFEPGQPLRVLTTDSEFHSFTRQIARYEELDNVTVERIPVEPIDTFQSRMRTAAARGGYQLLYMSHVFFNSGLRVPNVLPIVEAVPDDDTIIVIDGYHAFCAIPFTIRQAEDRIFYTAGGYKYAQSGESVCFLHVPRGCTLRPLDTGWFAAFGSMTGKDAAKVTYGDNGWRFAGATLEPIGAYRFNAVMDWWNELGITIRDVHEHAQLLKSTFLERLRAANFKTLRAQELILPPGRMNEGHFLTFRTDDANALQKRLAAARIITDSRADRLRFGFGLHQDLELIDELFARLKEHGF